MYIKDPIGIEDKSMDIIEKVMLDTAFKEDEKQIVKRMIHTTGDFDYRNIVVFKNDFICKAKETIRDRIIFTDTNMASIGINKKALNRANCELRSYISDSDIFEEARRKNTTRAICAVEKAVSEGIEIFVIGNAPTALFRLLELWQEKKVNPKFVVGVPVGFVGAEESKEYLRTFSIPSVTTVGTKGGSNVAASIVNALLYMVTGR